MNADKNTPRLLGAAFLLQAVASAVSGLFLLQPLIVSGNIVDSMTNIANHAVQMRASIVVEMITAIGIVMLGALLFVTLRKQNGSIALVALGLYLIEAAILAASRIPAFSLLRTSQESVLAGHPAYLQTLGNLFYEAQSFGYRSTHVALCPWGNIVLCPILQIRVSPTGSIYLGPHSRPTGAHRNPVYTIGL